MNVNIEFLDPGRKLADETVDRLCGVAAGDGNFTPRIRKTPEGVMSLEHLMVIVPTAQSGRNLRLALAQKAAEMKWGGLIPPKIAMANTLLVPSDLSTATEAEELAVMADLLAECSIGKFKALFPKPPAVRTVDWALDTAAVLLDIEMILGEAGILMSAVEPSVDRERWRDLAEIEGMFIAALKAKGVVPRSVARLEAIKRGCGEDGIEEIILPSAVDIQNAFTKYLENSPQRISVWIHAKKEDVARFDGWGRPKEVFAASIPPGMIEPAPTAVVEADNIARFFRAVEKTDAWPALVVCDSEMHPELEGAFQNHFSEEELVLRNPSKERIANSSLGRLLSAIVEFKQSGEYDMFSTLIRMGDVARWAQGALGTSPEETARYIGALDAVQNVHLPRTIDEAIAGAEAEAQNAWSREEREAAAGLKRFAEAVKTEIGDPFSFLKKIFASLVLDEKNPGDRELIAAAKVIRELREACASPLIPVRFRPKLFARLLDSASYMLEPTSSNVLATTGWLEVPWCLEDEMVTAGFNEGCVPENVVGHPFVPDSLRRELGVTSNADREARDSFIFAQAVACRKKGAVSVHLHQISGDKNVMKPSRILFNGISDADLPDLALGLYAVTKGNEGAPVKELPPAWRLALPFPPKGTVFRERISPTRLDQYFRCPLTFYLQEVFGERSDDRNQELDAMAFGNLCHSALDRFAKEGPADSVDADEIAAFLADEVRRQLRVFGKDLPAIIELQGEAAIERLKAFSVHQAARRMAGWKIAASEQTLECRIKGCPTLLRGKVDRIDRHEETGDLAIIDYKTWNRPKKPSDNKSIQLPVYRAMVETSAAFDPEKAHSSKAFYCILAEHPEDVMFDEEHCYHQGNQSEAEDKIVSLLTGIARGIFYSTKSNPEWQRDFASVIWESPEEGISLKWLEDQKARLQEQA